MNNIHYFRVSRKVTESSFCCSVLKHIQRVQLLQNEDIFSTYLINWHVFIFLFGSFEVKLPNKEKKKEKWNKREKERNKQKETKPICIHGL